MSTRKGAAVAGAVLSVLALAWVLHVKGTSPRRHLTLYLGTRPTEVAVSGATVAEALADLGVTMKAEDVVAPDLRSPVTEGLEIDLGSVERQVREARKTVPGAVHTEYTDTLNAGEIIDVQKGQDGVAKVQTETFSLNGVQAFEKVLKTTVLVPPKDAKVLEGTALRQKLYPLRKRMRVSKTLKFQATAYYPGPEDTWPYASGTTASGLKAGYGVAAVDPRVIRMKTPLYIEGYGYAIAADKGGAIKGNKIDLCFDTYEEAVRFGRKNVLVHILR